MKRKRILSTVGMLTFLSLFMLTGCNSDITPSLETDSVIQPITETPQSTDSPSDNGQGSRSSNPAISLERAIEIAYADLTNRGINATFSEDSGMSWERGQWVWELLFKTQYERMPLIEFYINADDGSIVKFEWDD